ncbi:hypothetical protein DPMN_024564, partial [Dreissena polymorpha]
TGTSSCSDKTGPSIDIENYPEWDLTILRDTTWWILRDTTWWILRYAILRDTTWWVIEVFQILRWWCFRYYVILRVSVQILPVVFSVSNTTWWCFRYYVVGTLVLVLVLVLVLMFLILRDTTLWVVRRLAE